VRKEASLYRENNGELARAQLIQNIFISCLGLRLLIAIDKNLENRYIHLSMYMKQPSKIAIYRPKQNTEEIVIGLIGQNF